MLLCNRALFTFQCFKMAICCHIAMVVALLNLAYLWIILIFKLFGNFMMYLVRSSAHAMLTSIGLLVFNQCNFLNELMLSLFKRKILTFFAYFSLFTFTVEFLKFMTVIIIFWYHLMSLSLIYPISLPQAQIRSIARKPLLGSFRSC